MNYLTNFYKNKCENLQEKLNLLESQLQYLQEAPDTSALRSIMGDKAYEQLMRQQEKERTKLQQESDKLVRGAMSVPSTAPGTMLQTSALSPKLPTSVGEPAGDPGRFHDAAPTDPSEPSPFFLDRLASSLGFEPDNYSAPSWKETNDAIRQNAAQTTAQAAQAVQTTTRGSKPLAGNSQWDSPFATSPKSPYGTPPSASYAPTEPLFVKQDPLAVRPSPAVKADEHALRDTKAERAVSDAARQALPSAARDVLKPQAPVPAGEDFSEFWKKKGHGQSRWHTDKELEEMMFRNKRSNMFGPTIPDEKQPIEYRAAKAELIRRGKLKG